MEGFGGMGDVPMGSVPSGGNAMGVLDGIGGGILSAGGSIIGGIINSGAQGAANEANIQMAREQMAFQEKMSNSAYSRATASMRDAGLNPALAYSQGGASTPPGQTASIQSTRPGDAVQSGIESARATLALKQDMDYKQQQIALAKAQAVQTQAQAAATAVTAKGQALKNEKQAAELPAEKKHGKYDEWAAPYDAIIRRVKEIVPYWLQGQETYNPRKPK